MVDSQNAIANSILDTIGSTPMIRLHRLNPNPAVDLLAKVEGFNPTGSIKDLKGEEKCLSVGVFGHVFTFSKENIDQALEGIL